MSAMQTVLKLCAAGGVTLGLLAGTAAAAPKDIEVTAPSQFDPDARVERVFYGDLNLASASHQKKLNGRVGRAVGNVCGPVETPGGMGTDYNACRFGAWASARPQISLAVRRAQEIAATGTSTIPPVAIVLAFPGR